MPASLGNDKLAAVLRENRRLRQRLAMLEQTIERLTAARAHMPASDPHLPPEQVAFNAAMNITERKQAEEAIKMLSQHLEFRVAELEAINKEIETFSYTVAHSLRTPLWTIELCNENLLEHAAAYLDAEQQVDLRRIQQCTLRMEQMIDDLLDFSRLTSRGMQVEPVNLSKLAREATALWDRAPGHQVELVVAEDVLAVGDALLLRIALENLLDNAWKFTRDQPQARIEFGVTQQDDQLAYFVRDNGVGFDQSRADKLFGVFQRLHNKSEFPGVGIGLATVRRIVHRHGGRVWAEGAPGQGATFYFTLPWPERS